MKDQIEPFLDFSLDERWYFNKIEEKKLFDPLQMKKSGLFDTHFRNDTSVTENDTSVTEFKCYYSFFAYSFSLTYTCKVKKNYNIIEWH